MKNRKWFLVAIVLSLGTAISAYFYLEDLRRAADPQQYGTVVVAAANIQAETMLGEELLVVRKIPVAYIQPGTYRSVDEVAGRMTTVQVFSGEQLLQERTAAPGQDRKFLAYRVPQGKRAVTIAVDEVSGIAGLIEPGDNVDVVATLEELTGLLLQNVEILAVGRRMGSSKTEESSSQTTITLAVAPEQGLRLILATGQGRVQLMLRSPVDQESRNLPYLKLQDLVGTAVNQQ